MTQKPTAMIESDGKDIFVVFNGVRVAKRGHPNTPQAGTWIALEPGLCDAVERLQLRPADAALIYYALCDYRANAHTHIALMRVPGLARLWACAWKRHAR
jgi:hypothetical protein